MQGEIIKCLKEAGKPLSRSQIAEQLKANPNTVSMRLKVLVKFEEIKCVEITDEEIKKKYNSKRLLHLYYL